MRMEPFFIGECKFKGRPFRYSEYLDTLAKLASEKEKADFYYGLFSESGFDEKAAAAAEKDDRIRLYTLDEVVGYEMEKLPKK